QMLGGYISYNIAFGGLLDLVWSITFGKGHIYTWVIITLSWGVIFPLSLLRKISSLRFTSLLGFLCSSYLVIVISIEYFLICSDNDNQSCFWSKNFNITKKILFNFNNFYNFILKYLNSFPLFVFAFVSHQFVLPVYVELQRKSRTRMLKAIYRALI